jgi:hypothetical protein
MPRSVVERAAQALGEHLVSVWVLLTQTTDFLSRTSVFSQYEDRLSQMNSSLHSSRGNEDVVREIRDELIQIRRSLRLSGYDLTLGNLELSLQGFRNDAALGEGFHRVVAFIGLKQVWCIVGQANHMELYKQLEDSLRRVGPAIILQKHYLWYRWDRDLLVLSGAATETAEDWETLKEWCVEKEHKLALLGRMKKFR